MSVLLTMPLLPIGILPVLQAVSDKYQFCFMHAARRSGLGAFNYISGTTQILPKLNLGLSWIRAGVDDIPIYPLIPAFDPNISADERRNFVKNRPRESDFTPAGYLNDSENAYVLTLATRLGGESIVVGQFR